MFEYACPTHGVVRTFRATQVDPEQLDGQRTCPATDDHGLPCGKRLRVTRCQTSRSPEDVQSAA
jgi:hypothetical protein